MAYRVEFASSAGRQLKKLKGPVVGEIRDEIDGLVENPRPHGCEKLSGYDGLYRVRVGDYRIVYAVSDSVVLVLVLKIGNRAEVYERIRKSDLAFVRQFMREAEPPPFSRP